MSTELVKKTELVNAITDYMDAFGLSSSLNDKEKKQFLAVAKAFQLNPFKREIYCIPYGTGQYRKLSLVTGYETYIKRAERSGKLDGWKVYTDGSIKDRTLKAIIEISRKDFKMPFVHEVYLFEYDQSNKMWKDKPVTMIKKVAISQGFRLCFSDEIGGMPYTADELPAQMGNIEAAVQPTPQESRVVQDTAPQKEKLQEDYDFDKEFQKSMEDKDGSGV